jgi:hypothetical protein
MISILTTLIDLLLIFIIFMQRQELQATLSAYAKIRDKQLGLTQKIRWELVDRKIYKYAKREIDKMVGLREAATRKAAIAEKTADRAFNMASSANLGVIALQKALAVPRLLTKEQGQRNELAKQNIDALFSGSDALDFLKPIATEDELLAIEKIQEDKRKQMLNGRNSA